MSRSYRKTPKQGVASSSGQKFFKQKEHRSERRTVKQSLTVGKEVLPDPKEYGNEWVSPRDGKVWFGQDKNNTDLNKFYVKGMRK